MRVCLFLKINRDYHLNTTDLAENVPAHFYHSASQVEFTIPQEKFSFLWITKAQQ